MGKTSLSRKSSQNSINSNKEKEKVMAPKPVNKTRSTQIKEHNKTQNRIKKLFKKLRSDSHTSINQLDDTENSTLCTNNSTLKFDRSGINAPCNSRLIVIDDDVKVENNPCSSTPLRNVYSHVSHSTPKHKHVDELIISHSMNILNDQVQNLTKEIADDSYVTIDLTTESTFHNGTVIDLETTQETLPTMISNTSSMSGESNVTVLNMNNRKRRKNSTSNDVQKFANGIANLNASDKGKLLELITKEIFSGCNVNTELKNNLVNNLKQSRTTDTAEDRYIKEVILNEKPSRNSVGSNIYHPDKSVRKTGLRMVVIDGSNVALEHSQGRVFSVKGLKICIDYFLRRGHVVKAFVPRFRCKFGKSTEPRLLDQLERQGHVIYTPSREIHGRNITPYDDRYIIQCAAEFDGVIVSGDQYRDLANENPRWRRVIETRLLPFTWVEDMIMFPRDPLGRNGPTLEAFLKH